MTDPSCSVEITADDSSNRQPGIRCSLQYLFNEIFVPAPKVLPVAAAAACLPFSNDTPPPSGETMREPPEGYSPKKPGLHLPPCPRTESDGLTSRRVLAKQVLV